MLLRERAVRRLIKSLLCVLVLLPVAMTSGARMLRVEPPLGQGSPLGRFLRLEGCACDSLWADSILYRFELSGTVFTFGDTVKMIYRITNHRSEPVTFTFPTSCQDWFAVYSDSCGPTIPGCSSTWALEMYCYQMMTYFILNPGESKEFRLDWRQHTDEGYRAPSGAYTAWGTLYSQEYFEPLLLSVPFQIVSYGPQPIQEVLNTASSGDTVLVAPGIYHENLVLLEEHAGIVLKAEGEPGETILDGGGRGSVIYAYRTGSETVIEGFTIRGGREGQGRDVRGLYDMGGGVTLLMSASPRISGNIVRDNRSDRGGGIACGGSAASPAIVGNIFLENHAGDWGGGVYAGFRGSNPAPLLSGNTFVANEAGSGGGAYDRGGLSRMQVRSNILYRNLATESGGGLTCFGDYNPTINVCNAFWQNIPDDMTDCPNVIDPVFADPLFCSAGGEDFHLQDTSPCAPRNNPDCGLIGALDVGCQSASADVRLERARFIVGPNPSSGSVVFRIPQEWTVRLPGKQATLLEIVDVGGRCLRRLPVSVTETSLLWDGRDADGRKLPSGVYLARVLQGRQERAGRILIRVR